MDAIAQAPITAAIPYEQHPPERRSRVLAVHSVPTIPAKQAALHRLRPPMPNIRFYLNEPSSDYTLIGGILPSEGKSNKLDLVKVRAHRIQKTRVVRVGTRTTGGKW